MVSAELSKRGPWTKERELVAVVHFSYSPGSLHLRPLVNTSYTLLLSSLPHLLVRALCTERHLALSTATQSCSAPPPPPVPPPFPPPLLVQMVPAMEMLVLCCRLLPPALIKSCHS